MLDLVEPHRSTIVFANSRRLAERLTARLNELATERAGLRRSTTARRRPQLMAQAGAGAPGRRRRRRPRPPRLGVPRAARARRGGSQGRPAAGRRRHVQPRTRHRHGRGRPRRAGRVAAVGRLRAAAGRPGRAPGRRRIARRDLPEVPRRSGRVRRRRRADARRRDRVDALPAQPARRARPADRRDGRARAESPSTRSRRSCAAPPRSPGCPARRSRRRSTCSPGATRPTRSPSCVRGWCGTASPASSPRAAGAQRLAVTSGGTIPDRGLFGVFLASGDGPGRRVGELDEEMVYESRVGDVFLLGSSSWRIEDITHDRVLVTPAPGQLGQMPFWKGRFAGPAGRARPRARRLPARGVDGAARRGRARRRAAAGLDEWGTDNLLAYLAEQREATGHLPDDRTVLVERFRDELGDWRLVVHSPFGAPVNAPWALAIGARLRERYGLDVSTMHSDDGIVLRLPDTDGERARAPTSPCSRPDEIEAIVTDRGRRLGAVRVALPRVRGALAAAAPPRPAPPHAAVAAAAARQPAAAGGRPSTATSRSCSRRCASACRTSTTCPAWSG